jgi:beta-lactamase superfamily II metal-dependent hydrolase
MFAIEMLPAEQGDALWIEYGSGPTVSRILIDGGTPPTVDAVVARVEKLAPTDRHFELLIVTHVDTDHIGGILKFLADPPAGLTFDDVWFNGWPQLEPLTTDLPLGEMTADAILGPKDGEILDRLLDLRVGALVKSHNKAFGGGAAMVPPSGPLPTHVLGGGMTLTLLAPGRPALRKLRAEWVEVIRDANRTEDEVRDIVDAAARQKGVDLTLGARLDVGEQAAMKFRSDRSPANESSIVVLAQFDGKRALLTGDGLAPAIASGLDRLLTQPGDRLSATAVKLPHHGSRDNTSLPMLQRLDCQRFLVSSSGAIFGHPDVEAIARVIVTNGPDVELGFNYSVETTDIWNDAALQGDPEYPFTTRYPDMAGEGLRTEL